MSITFPAKQKCLREYFKNRRTKYTCRDLKVCLNFEKKPHETFSSKSKPSKKEAKQTFRALELYKSDLVRKDWDFPVVLIKSAKKTLKKCFSKSRTEKCLCKVVEYPYCRSFFRKLVIWIYSKRGKWIADLGGYDIFLHRMVVQSTRQAGKCTKKNWVMTCHKSLCWILPM